MEKAEFDPKMRKLDLHLNFEAGGVFECGGCGGVGCKAYATAWKPWRHLNFFQHEAFLHAPVARVKCPWCGIRRARVPSARPRSGFTLLFEALVVTLLNEAVEKVRRTEQKGRPELKRSQWLWLWNPERLTPEQRHRLDGLVDPSQIALDTAEAYRLKLALQEFWDLPPTWRGFTSK